MKLKDGVERDQGFCHTIQQKITGINYFIGIAEKQTKYLVCSFQNIRRDYHLQNCIPEAIELLLQWAGFKGNTIQIQVSVQLPLIAPLNCH